MSDAQGINRIWLLILLGISLVYLMFEWAFNAFLVDQVYSFDKDVNFTNIEVRGRFLAATGFSLLLVKGCLPKITVGIKRIALTVLLIAIGFPAAYFGQKALVETLVNSTTAQERMEAQYLLLLKRGLSSGAVQFDGLEFTQEELESVSAKTFVASMGFMTFFSVDFVDRLRGKVDTILNTVADHEAHRALPDVYKEYQPVQKKIKTLYKDYIDAMQKREDEIVLMKRDGARAWQDYYQNLSETYQEQKEKLSKHELDVMTSDFMVLFAQYQKGLRTCHGSGCKKYHDQYRDAVMEAFNDYVEPSSWCLPAQKKKVVLRQGFVMVEREVVGAPICDPLPFDHVHAKILNVVGAAVTWADFIKSDRSIERARARLKEEGLEMPDDWVLDSQEQFISAYEREGIDTINTQIQKEMQDQFKAILPFDLDAQTFVAHPELQRVLKDDFGLDQDDPDIRINMTLQDILNDYLLPKAREQAQNDKDDLEQKAQAFGDGNAREADGKTFVRILLIPPIAMLFSLFFSAANLIEVIAGLCKFNPRISGGLRHGFQIILLCILVFLPVLIPSPITNKASFKYFYNETSETISPAISYASRWMITVQPILYPVGSVSSMVTDRVAPIILKTDEQDRTFTTKAGD